MASLSAVHHPELFESKDILDEHHDEILRRAVQNVLSTDVAELVYGQILDGLPLADVYNGVIPWMKDHSVNTLPHTELCPGSLEKAREFRKEFSFSDLRFHLKPLSAFQEEPKGSDQFKLRLIELVAVACHQVGAYLYRLDKGTHPHSFYAEWVRQVAEERRQGVKSRRFAYYSEIAFAHRAFQSSKNYPQGFADVAGYWVEGQLFAGVIIFDRGESESETLFPLTKEQFDALIDFLLADSDKKLDCPLPIKATKDNRPRWDPHKAFADYHIFRDRYERVILPPRGHPQDVHDARDWPELEDKRILALNSFQNREGFPRVSEKQVQRAQANIWNITPTSPLWPQFLAMQDAKKGLGSTGEGRLSLDKLDRLPREPY